MIKEKRKKTKYNTTKTNSQIITEYVKTILVSIFVGIVITTFLAIDARNSMIKNFADDKKTQNAINKAIAEQIIQSTDLMADLPNKRYEICIKVGDLYMAVNDYKNAELAYTSANLKDKPGMYTADYKLICALIEQEKFKQAELLLCEIKDENNKKLIKFKTRAYMIIGDKYYSLGKFLSAAKNYETSSYYYNKFTKQDKVIVKSITNRIALSYIHAADIMVSSGRNTDAYRFLTRAEKLAPNNLTIKYKIGIILSDLEPEKAVKYIEPLLDKIPQDIDYAVYCNALMKSANIADLDGRPTEAKYYRYKIHSYDMFVNRKLIYKNDVIMDLKSFPIKKILFAYPIKATFSISNASNNEIDKLYGNFTLRNKDGKIIESVDLPIATKEDPLHQNNINLKDIEVKFNKKAFTKKELNSFTIEVQLYKDKKYKTTVFKTKLPDRQI